MVCMDPKEKESWGPFHLGRKGAWNEDKKEVIGVHTAYFLLSTGGKFHIRQYSVMAKRWPQTHDHPALSFLTSSAHWGGNSTHVTEL